MRLRFAAGALALSTLLAQDAAKISPNVRVEIDNQWVRVLRVKEDAGDRVAMHAHPSSVAIYLTDARQRITAADGQMQTVVRKAGEVAYRDPVRHAEENISDQPMEAVVIELKPDAPKLKPAPVALDPVKLDPEHHIVAVENDRVRVLRTILEPHLKAPMHEHPHYVVVYLTELHTTMQMADGKTIDNVRRAGEAAWRDPLKHATENVGDRTAVEIQVELK